MNTPLKKLIALNKKSLTEGKPKDVNATEWGCTIKDIKEAIASDAMASERLNNKDWADHCAWFNLSEKEKSEAIKSA